MISDVEWRRAFGPVVGQCRSYPTCSALTSFSFGRSLLWTWHFFLFSIARIRTTMSGMKITVFSKFEKSEKSREKYLRRFEEFETKNVIAFERRIPLSTLEFVFSSNADERRVIRKIVIEFDYNWLVAMGVVMQSTRVADGIFYWDSDMIITLRRVCGTGDLFSSIRSA